jgi:hypothetical protein
MTTKNVCMDDSYMSYQMMVINVVILTILLLLLPVLLSLQLRPPQPRNSRNITLFVEFQGKLGNYLSKLASARITQLIAQRNIGV